MAESMENSQLGTASDFYDEISEASDFYDKISEVCQPCSFEGKRLQANRFCVDCHEYLCQTCHTYHKALRLTRNHVLVTNEDAKKITLVIAKDKCSYKCTVHNDKSIKYFCVSHSYLGCSVCITIDHKQCKDINYIPKVAEDIRNLDGFKKFDEKLKTLETAYKASIAEVQNNLKQIGSDERQLKVVLKDFRKKMNNFFDKFENKLTAQAKQINIEETQKLNVLSRKLATSLVDVDTLLKEVNTLLSSGKYSDTYVLMKKEASHLAALNKELVNTTQVKTHQRYYEFQPNNDIFKAGALGKLSSRTVSYSGDCAEDWNEDIDGWTGSTEYYANTGEKTNAESLRNFAVVTYLLQLKPEDTPARKPQYTKEFVNIAHLEMLMVKIIF